MRMEPMGEEIVPLVPAHALVTLSPAFGYVGVRKQPGSELSKTGEEFRG
jgi:hypothetical protein